MLFCKTESRCPAFNLACEEYYLRDRREDVFLLWQNDPVVVIGKNQNVYDEVCLDYAREHGIQIIRRITGGGAVYHDHGNVNYTFITSREKAQSLDFAYFTRPIVAALHSMGIEAKLSGRNDLLAGELKFSGNAQYSTSDRILHHGTLLFNSQMDVLSSVLKPAPEKLRSKKIQSVRSRVVNLATLLPEEKRSLDGFLQGLQSFVEAYFSCQCTTVDAEAVIASGYMEKYNTEQWLYGRSKSYSHRCSRRYPFGTLVLLWDEEDGVITSLCLEGDFFSLEDTLPLERGLLHTALRKEALVSRLQELELHRYFQDLRPEDLAEQFLTEA